MKEILIKIGKWLALIAFITGSALVIYNTVVSPSGEVKLDNIDKADSLIKNSKDSIKIKIDSLK